MRRVLIIGFGALLGLFFAALAATGIGMLFQQTYVSKAYDVAVIGIGGLFAYAGFRLMGTGIRTHKQTTRSAH